MISTASAHLAPKEHCTGCSACASGCPRGAIKMVADKEGFLYPQVTDACVHCGHCTHICPALKHREQRPEPTVFAVWNEDEAQRRLSTSGGAFAAIAGFVLESGGVVFGAAMDGDMRVVHTAIQSKEDLPRLMGTKLVQSDMGECFQQVRYYLDRGTFVFFTGTPCQVDGLYRYLGESPELLLTADTLCSGVPSPGVWSKVVDAMHYIKQRRVTAVQFCKKLTGSESRFVVDFEGGGQYDAPLGKSDYGRGLFRGLFLRPACYHCTCCSTNRVADLTFGSFKGLPSDFYPQQQKLGVSMLLINTVKGAHIFDMIPLHREKRTLAEAVAGNPALSHPAAFPKERAAFCDAFINQPFHKVYQRFFSISDWSYRRTTACGNLPALWQRILTIAAEHAMKCVWTGPLNSLRKTGLTPLPPRCSSVPISSTSAWPRLPIKRPGNGVFPSYTGTFVRDFAAVSSRPESSDSICKNTVAAFSAKRIATQSRFFAISRSR